MKPFIELVKERVKFDHYRDGKLYYQTDSGFLFEIPISDSGTGTFLREDKGILFMRWMKPQYEEYLKTVTK